MVYQMCFLAKQNFNEKITVCYNCGVYFFYTATASKLKLFYRNDNPIVNTSADPFTPYLNSVPNVLEVISTLNSGPLNKGITTKEIIFRSKNGANKIYGVLAYPQRAGKFPGVLVLYAGDGNAQNVKGGIERLARSDYAAFACDMAGFFNITTTPNSNSHWKASLASDERPRFYLTNSPQNSTLVYAEVAGIEAFNLLRSQPNVYAVKMGITGYYGGSYSTTMLSGLLGNKLKAAYAYWGAGFYDKGTYWKNIIAELPDSMRKAWLEYFDAGRRAQSIKADYFIEAAVNDTYFWQESVSATLRADPKRKNHVWCPNLNHSEVSTSAMMQKTYFNFYLKGEGSAFSCINISSIKTSRDSAKQVMITLKIAKGVSVRSVQLYYSEPKARWDARKWTSIAAT